MDVKVVDASALAAIVFDEPGGDEVAARLEGARLVAPVLLEFELVNVCLTKLRQHPDTRAAILEAFVLQGGLTIESEQVDHAATLTLAEQTRLSGYDASYLWLAQRLNAELVTLDRPLGCAAAALGLAPPPRPTQA
jgi:predicted nucleic acid-binding protein